MVEKYDFTRELLSKIDILVDGQFIEEKKIEDLRFRGSYNQRKIDVQASLASKNIVTLKFGDEARYEKKKENPKIIWITKYTDNLQKTKEPEYSTVSNTIEENENIVQTKEYVISKEKIKIAAKGIG